MALETLKNVKEVNGYNVIVMDELRAQFPKLFNEDGGMNWKVFESEIRPENFIYLRHDKNSVSFTIQNGPVGANGVNGCQVDEIIAVARLMLQGLQDKFPCRENACAITKLQEAEMWLQERKKDRERRGVEGQNKV